MAPWRYLCQIFLSFSESQRKMRAFASSTTYIGGYSYQNKRICNTQIWELQIITRIKVTSGDASKTTLKLERSASETANTCSTLSIVPARTWYSCFPRRLEQPKLQTTFLKGKLQDYLNNAKFVLTDTSIHKKIKRMNRKWFLVAYISCGVI